MDSILVDTDPALGLRWRDIDDALALHAVWRAGRLAGITTVFGNVSQAQVAPIAETLGARWGVPVYRGANHPGHSTTAAVEALIAHRGPVLALGPCTNIAAAIARGAVWPSLVLLGGTTRQSPNLRYLHPTELNFALDPGAAAITLPHATLLVPMEVCRQVVFLSPDLEPLPSDLRAQCDSWLRIAPLLTGTAGFHPWDLVAAATVLHPELVTVRLCPTTVMHRFPYRGRLLPTGCRIPTAISLNTLAFRRWWAGMV